MKKSEKILVIISMVLVLIAVGLFLYFEVSSKAMFGFAVVSFIVMGIISIIMFSSKTNTDNPFMREVNRILKVYDAVLVNSKNLPNLNGRDIVVVSTIRDLVDAQATVRKPIYYNLVEDSCSFVLLSEKEANVFILKASENVTCPLEVIINERKNGEPKVDDDHKILDNIDKTTVIQLPNKDEVKISPIRDNNEPSINPVSTPHPISNEPSIKPIDTPKPASNEPSIKPIETAPVSGGAQIMPISDDDLPKPRE